MLMLKFFSDFIKQFKLKAKMIMSVQTLFGFIIKKAEDGLLQNRYARRKEDKMKAVRTAGLTVFITLFFFVSAYGADTKIGIIDFQKVLRESKGGKAAKAEIETKGKGMEKNLRDQGEQLEKLKKKLEAEAMVMSKEVREEKEREFRIKVGDFKALQKKYADELRDFEGEIIKRVQKDVFDIVEAIGRSGNFQLILEKGAVLYYPDALDVTDELIKRYNAK